MDGNLYCANCKGGGNDQDQANGRRFLVQSRPVNLSKQQFEILVPSGELEEVQEVLNSILHP